MNLYKVINNVKIFINDIENTFINISKNNKYNVNYIKELGNDLLEYLIIYSYSKKEIYLKKSVVKVNLIDYNIGKLYKNRYISEKALIKLSRELREIYNLLYKLF